MTYVTTKFISITFFYCLLFSFLFEVLLSHLSSPITIFFFSCLIVFAYITRYGKVADSSQNSNNNDDYD